MVTQRAYSLSLTKSVYFQRASNRQPASLSGHFRDTVPQTNDDYHEEVFRADKKAI